jgi:hypothetical protein
VEDVDLNAGPVAVTSTVVPLKGRGLTVKSDEKPGGLSGQPRKARRPAEAGTSQPPRSCVGVAPSHTGTMLIERESVLIGTVSD